MNSYAVSSPLAARFADNGFWQIVLSQYPMPRIRMLDGFNEGWINFQDGGSQAGRIDAAAVIATRVNDLNAQRRNHNG